MNLNLSSLFEGPGYDSTGYWCYRLMDMCGKRSAKLTCGNSKIGTYTMERDDMGRIVKYKNKATIDINYY